MPKPPIYIRGMHGIGDNLHQRAVIRLLKETHNVTLESSWHSLYHDLLDEDFRVCGRTVNLRTQQKNAQREAHLFAPTPPHHHVPGVSVIRYVTSTINQTTSGTITEAMLRSIGLGQHFMRADFRLPLKDEWLAEADRIMGEWPTGGKPVMIYRPLLARPEWMGSQVRNANTAQYQEMAEMLHEKYFIVSVADLEPTKEWIVGPEFAADMKYHGGEFVFEILAAIFQRADLIFTSGGFAAILGPAVETPTISMLGGYEPASWCADGAKFSPYLVIEPISPCNCGSSGCNKKCSKVIDMPTAKARVADFVSMAVGDCKPATQTDCKSGDKMLNLPDVTLFCVETQAHELARIAMNDAVSKVNFGGVLVYTDHPELVQVPGAQYFTVPNWPDKFAAESFYYMEAAMPAKTSHVLALQWDAGIRDVAMWRDEFLAYDYIGAPWNLRPDEGRYELDVGNGGFALWSKRLADHIHANRARFNIRTDYGIARDARPACEKEIGAKWASRDVAWDFAFENPPPGTARRDAKPSFGYHDIFNWPLALPQEEVIRRTRLVMANRYTLGTTKLRTLGNEWAFVVPGIGADAFNNATHTPRSHRPNALQARGRSMPPRPPGAPRMPMPPLPVRHTVSRQEWELALQARGLKA